MVDMAFFRGGLGRWLPPSVPPVDEAVLLRRCWELLVLDRPGTAQDIPRPLRWGRLPPEALLLAAGAWLLAEGRLPD